MPSLKLGKRPWPLGTRLSTLGVVHAGRGPEAFGQRQGMAPSGDRQLFLAAVFTEHADSPLSAVGKEPAQRLAVVVVPQDGAITTDVAQRRERPAACPAWRSMAGHQGRVRRRGCSTCPPGDLKEEPPFIPAKRPKKYPLRPLVCFAGRTMTTPFPAANGIQAKRSGWPCILERTTARKPLTLFYGRLHYLLRLPQEGETCNAAPKRVGRLMVPS